jgi:1-pyrroline-5-carboxylate dehydrogenase
LASNHLPDRAALSPETKLTYVTLLADPSIHPKYESALKKVEADFGKHHPMFINGRKVLATEGEFDVRSPLDTKILLGYFQKGNGQYARKAIEAGKDAFEEWSKRPWKERVAIIRKAADLMEEERFRLAALITYEVGKNRYEAVAEASEAIDMVDYYADLMEQNDGYVKAMQPGAPGETSKSVLRPYGVWAVISPFNFPLALAAGMVASALVTGNTVIFHPTSAAPLSGLLLYETLIKAGIPDGALSYVTGPGESFGDEVTRNLDVAGIAFTGSKDVGMKLYRDFVNKQPYPKPFIAEMGSKNPAIISSSADLEKAAEGVVRGAFGYSGQKCSATSRVYVERGVKNDFLKILKDKVDHLQVGDPREKESFVGPVINEKMVKKYQRYLELAKKDGGKIIAGGLPEDKKLSKGYYVKPTVVTGLPSNDRLLKEELFLPFVVVDEVKNLDEALEKANDTEFGLTAGIFSNDQNEMDMFFKKIDFGVTYANRKGGATTGAWPGSQSFGGWKGSGATGKGVGGPYYLLGFMHEQAQTIVKDT